MHKHTQPTTNNKHDKQHINIQTRTQCIHANNDIIKQRTRSSSPRWGTGTSSRPPSVVFLVFFVYDLFFFVVSFLNNLFVSYIYIYIH